METYALLVCIQKMTLIWYGWPYLPQSEGLSYISVILI